MTTGPSLQQPFARPQTSLLGLAHQHASQLHFPGRRSAAKLCQSTARPSSNTVASVTGCPGPRGDNRPWHCIIVHFYGSQEGKSNPGRVNALSHGPFKNKPACRDLSHSCMEGAPTQSTAGVKCKALQRPLLNMHSALPHLQGSQ